MRKSNDTIVATKDHVAFCFDTLAGHFSGDRAEPAFNDAFCPLFVTWNKVNQRGQSRLRGCIGTLQSRVLHKALREYALASALNDRRFPPVSAEELALLQCTVSLLHSFETAAHWSDWTLGVHGLIINFKDPTAGVHLNATFLPEVAAHEGWSQMQTLEALIRKAGYSGRAQALLHSLEVTRYQSTACSMSYSEYFSTKQTRELVELPDPSLEVTVPA